MANNHDIETYSKLGEGINFYLSESFHYLNEVLIYEYASIIFSKYIDKIDPTEVDRKLIENLSLPDNPVELLQTDIIEAISDETASQMASSWENAQQKARLGQHSFGHQHEINSIEILGHLNNFGFFIETLVNRHLLFLNHINEIDNLSYSRISTARIIDRLIYIFKDDLKLNKVQINEIVNLFSLRNKTVHYTPDNAKALKPKLSELLKIWKQTKKVIEMLEKKEKFSEDNFSELLEQNINKIIQRWK
jgi:hypothetical protein